MTRKTATSSKDGMSLIGLMPFPALNPLNWWALAQPTNALRASMHSVHATLEAWRASADGMRALMRAQQDAALAMLEPKTDEAAAKPAPATDEAPQAEADSEAAAARFVAPMVEVTRAYGRMGRAFIVAQRDTMRAFSDAGRPN